MEKVVIGIKKFLKDSPYSQYQCLGLHLTGQGIGMAIASGIVGQPTFSKIVRVGCSFPSMELFRYIHESGVLRDCPDVSWTFSENNSNESIIFRDMIYDYKTIGLGYNFSSNIKKIFASYDSYEKTICEDGIRITLALGDKKTDIWFFTKTYPYPKEPEREIIVNQHTDLIKCLLEF